jgi:predicted Ser/Thr protein kinase
VTEEGNRGDASDSVDSLLRELAHAPEALPPREPERLGRFRITGRLGAGGMGVVYRAEDESLHRTVAIKVVPPSLQGDEERRRRLVREARAAAAVTHPNIAAVYEIGESAGRVFLAMEYVEGPTLRSLLAGGAMPLAKALPIALQIAEGLAKAHRANIVHRDLKPDNVIVSVDGHAKILDFGLAKLRATGATAGATVLAETVTAEGQMVGTPAYASPEQARGEAVGPPTDVFAFGVTLYEMLTGQRPFAGSSIAELIGAIDRDAPKPASSSNPEVPESLDGVLAKCLAKSPRERFANGDELVTALRSGLDVTSDVTAVRPPRGAARRMAWSNPWLVLAALALVVLVAGAYRTQLAPAGTAGTAGGNASAAPAESASAPRAWVRMTERPPPKSSSAAALAAYRMAIQDYRDASLAHAHLMMRGALKEDPELAAAHLRESLSYSGNLARMADSELGPPVHYRRAVGLRETLDEHDRELLRIADAIYANAQRDPTLALARAREARARFPGDEEIELEAAILQAELGGPSAFDTLRDLVARAAPFALAEWHLLDPSAYNGDRVAWRAACERCVAGTPQAASCLSVLSLVENVEGHCQEFEAVRRRRVLLDPESPGAHRFLGLALAANGAPYEVAFGEFKYLGDRGAELARGMVYLERGDFSAAERTLASAQAAFEKDADDDVGGEVLVLRALAAEEAGDLAAAAQMAKAALGKPTVRNGSHGLSPDPRRGAFSVQAAVGLVHRAGGLSSSRAIEFALPLPGAPLPSPEERLSVEAGLLVEVADDQASARTALEALQRADALAGGSNAVDADPVGRNLYGRARWLAGDGDGAAADLEAAAQFCLAEDSPFAIRRSALLLGEIRESQKNQPAACAAYARVLARWGDAKPRSITADKARARSKALGCSP